MLCNKNPINFICSFHFNVVVLKFHLKRLRFDITLVAVAPIKRRGSNAKAAIIRRGGGRKDYEKRKSIITTLELFSGMLNPHNGEERSLFLEDGSPDVRAGTRRKIRSPRSILPPPVLRFS